MNIFLKTERIVQGVRNFFSSKRKDVRYLSGVQKNNVKPTDMELFCTMQKTKRLADVKSRSNTGRLRGMR
jgi:hypothetical protein